MEKQVIIDKGGGMYERVIWDDSTKERIPEDTIGFLKGDEGVVTIVGNEFIGQNASLFTEKTFPSECKYCKPGLPNTGLKIVDQCRLLSAIKIEFTKPYCVYGSTLFNISCALQLPKLKFLVKFYDQNNKEYDSLLIDPNQLNFSGYLHTALPHTITVEVVGPDLGTRGKEARGGCIRKFKYLAYLGAQVECVIDLGVGKELDIIYDPKRHLILYEDNKNNARFPNEINLITTDNTYGPHKMTTIKKGVVIDYTTQPALGWIEGYGTSYLLRNVNFGSENDYYNTIAILGLNNRNTSGFSNFLTIKTGTLDY